VEGEEGLDGMDGLREREGVSGEGVVGEGHYRDAHHIAPHRTAPCHTTPHHITPHDMSYLEGGRACRAQKTSLDVLCLIDTVCRAVCLSVTWCVALPVLLIGRVCGLLICFYFYTKNVESIPFHVHFEHFYIDHSIF